MPVGKGGLGREGPVWLRRNPPPAGSPKLSRAPSQRGDWALGAALRKLPSGGAGGRPRSGRRTVYLLVSQGRRLPPGLLSPPGPGTRPRQPPTCSPGPSPGSPVGALPEGVEEGAASGDPAAQLSRLLRAPSAAAADRCGCCAAAARVASVGPLNFLLAFTPHP